MYYELYSINYEFLKKDLHTIIYTGFSLYIECKINLLNIAPKHLYALHRMFC